MEFYIPRKTLLKVLSFCQSISEKKTTLPILSHFLLRALESSLQITTTNLDMVLIEETPADVKKEGAWCVPAALLYDIVRKLEGDERVHMIFDATKHRLILNYKRSNFQIPVLEADKFPDITRTQLDVTFEIPSMTLKKLIDETKFCVSTEEIRYHLNGIYFHKKDDHLFAVATDLLRLALSRADDCVVPEIPSMIVGKRAVQEIRKLIEDDPAKVVLGVSATRIECTIETELLKATFASRLIDASYPFYGKVFEVQFDKKVVFEREILEKMLDRLAIVVDEKVNRVFFSFSENQLVVESSNKELGAAREELTIEYPYESFMIQVNIFFVLDVLRNQKCEKIEWWMKSPFDSILIKPHGADYPQFAIMPVAN